MFIWIYFGARFWVASLARTGGVFSKGEKAIQNYQMHIIELAYELNSIMKATYLLWPLRISAILEDIPLATHLLLFIIKYDIDYLMMPDTVMMFQYFK